MSAAAAFPDLFSEAQAAFQEIILELREYEIEVSPSLELRRVVAMLSYYDFDDGHIYLGLPSPEQSLGRLVWLMGRSAWACESDEELAGFLRAFVPRLLAHELGHHLRHRYGTLTTDKWHEEQVANQLATAVMNRRLSHDDRVEAIRIVRRALQRARGEDGAALATTYHDMLGALNTEGMLGDETVGTLEALQTALALSPEELLQSGAIPSDDMVRLLARREDAIGQINSQYVSDQMQYMTYHLGWLYYDLTNRQTATIDEFARVHLGLGDPVLAPPYVQDAPSADAVRACHRAHVACKRSSETASRYFYKRYRSLLIAALRASSDANGAEAMRDGSVEALLENWSGEEQDTLDFLSAITPPSLRELLPHRIGDDGVMADSSALELPTSTDTRIWMHVIRGRDDPSAKVTLDRLKLLEQSSVFEYLPAEVLLRIAASLNRLRLRAGETVIWQGDHTSDIHLVVEGELGVLMSVVGRLRQIGRLRAGEVFGEMAFFTGAPRSATIRANTDGLCFVLKASDLRALVYQHPVILMQMARSLAKRLETASASQKTLV